MRFQLTLVGAELKYRRGQSRLPKGQTGGGRFADEGRGATRAPNAAKPALQAATSAAARAALANPEAAMVAAAAAAPIGMGVVGVSRAAGLAAQAANGGGLTPIMNIPIPSFVPHAFINRGGGQEPVPKGEFDDICEEQLNKDFLTYQTNAAMYGRTPEARRSIAVVCQRTAYERYSECLRDGAPRSPLFDGRRFDPPGRRKK